MLEQKTCVNGHTWDEAADSVSTLVLDPNVCPVCSAAALPEGPTTPRKPSTPRQQASDGTLAVEPPGADGVPPTQRDGTIVMELPKAPAQLDGTIEMEPSEAAAVLPAQLGGTIAMEASEAASQANQDATMAMEGVAQTPQQQVDGTIALPPSAEEVAVFGTIALEQGASGDDPNDGTMHVPGAGVSVRHDATIEQSGSVLAGSASDDKTVKGDPDVPRKATGPKPGPAVALAMPHIAGYEVLKELGRGGMGVVYKARQQGLNRTVALKMILAAGHASPQTMARFRAEAEAIAQFQHPNIVQIYEVSEQDGKPFFSLEFVDGGCLADKIQGIPQVPREAAQLVALLSDAMDSAHRRGIIHRDLKPANILLSDKGEPKITDFGLAKKFDEDSGQTREGAIMGTPSYMAPEQAAGKTKELGPTADIYSLGAILYDLTTGRPPFRGETLLATLQAVKHDEPVAPSRLQPKLPRDLETICLKCLNKDPNKRYATAAGLADDLRRFLNNEPIQARATTTTERVWKWTKRHPAVAALIGVIAASLLVFTIVAVLVAVTQARLRNEADRQRTLAQTNEEIANVEKAKAIESEKTAQEARQKSDRNLQHATTAIDSFLSEFGTQKFQHEPRLAEKQRKMLGEARNLWVTILKDENPNDPTAQLRTGQAFKRLGDIEQMMGNRDDARKNYQQALIHLGTAAAVNDNADPHGVLFDMVITRMAFGKLLRDLGKHEEALKVYTLALEDGGKLKPPDEQSKSADQQALAQVHLNLALLFQETKKTRDAEEHMRDAIALLKSLSDADPMNLAYKFDLAIQHGNFGNQLLGQHQLANARKECEESVRLLQTLVKDHGENVDYQSQLAQYQGNLAVMLLADGKASEAEQQFTESIQRVAQLANKFTDRPEIQFLYGRTMRNIGAKYFLEKDFVRAEQLFRDAIDKLKELVGKFKLPDYEVELAAAYVGLAEVLQSDPQKREEVEECYKLAVEKYENLASVMVDVPMYKQLLAKTYYDQADYLAKLPDSLAKADAAVLNAIVEQKSLVRDHGREPIYRQELGRSFNLRGAIWVKWNKIGKEPEQYYLKALETWEKLPSSPPLELERINTYRNLGALYTIQGKHSDARDQHLKAVQGLVQMLKNDQENATLAADLAESQKDLAGSYLKLNDVAKADESVREAIALLTRLVEKTKSPAQRESLATLYYLLLAHIIIAADQNALQAVELVKDFAPVMPEGWPLRPEVARLMARCVEIAEKDDKLGNKKKEIAGKCADEAVKLLQTAVNQGLKDAAGVLDNADFLPLKDHPEFKKLREMTGGR